MNMSTKGNILIAHGGGSSAVINSSLYGAIMIAKRHLQVGAIYGALGGTAGILAEKFIDFRNVPQEKLELLKQTPGTSIGTSRTHLTTEDYKNMISIFEKFDIKYVLFNGGNGTMDTCGKVYHAAKELGIRVVGIPKTIDNDIAITDHCPGYGSAARYLAQTVADISQDVRSMPIHVCIVEAMGRNTGWITGAAALAKKDPEAGPHLIYLPEIAFEEEKFLSDVKRLYDLYGGVVVVASEGLKKADGSPIVDPIFQVGRSTYFGDVSAHLAELVIKKLGIKARSEKPGIAGRSSSMLQSKVDRDEAILAGEAACRAVLEGRSGVTIGFQRVSDEPYKIKVIEIPIEEVMLHERPMPKEFIREDGSGVTDAFLKWLKPLVGEDLLEFVWFNR
jgi:6-phosphofructokinase 1